MSVFLWEKGNNTGNFKNEIVIVLYIELYQYVKNAKSPTFDGFINKHQAQIAEWPIKIETCDAQALHRAWVSRFNDAIRSTRKDISLK